MRAIKNLFVLLIILALIAGGGLLTLRVLRGKPSAPEQIKPNVVAVSSIGVYMYAARAGDKVVLFDTGADPYAKTVDAALGALQASRIDISDVFVTHGHGDHTAGASGLPGVKIRMGAADVALAEGKVPPEALLPKLLAKGLSFPAVTATDPLTGATTIDVGGDKKVKAFPVAGHTSGSYAFLYDGVLFVGDAMVFKQGRLDPPLKLLESNLDASKAAIRELNKTVEKEEFEIVCTGHGGCTPKGLGRNLLSDRAGRV
jgi:glyoxylase-like metal-dependent hydrolase (beta-lactamase superfamily II)